jgi:hypothetical protein
MDRIIDSSDARQQFADLDAACERALASAGRDRVDQDLIFGGQLVRFRGAGRQLCTRMLRPFEHLRVAHQAGTTPALRIDAFEQRLSGGAPAALATGDDSAVAADGRYMLQRSQGRAAGFDRRRPHIVAGADGGADVGVYELGKPLSRFVAEWYADAGVPIVHGGCVVSDGDGVLLAGRGGSGKSTLAVACAAAGLGFIGEDYVGVTFDEGDVVGHSAYASAFIAPEARRWFPDAAPFLIDGAGAIEPKSVLLMADWRPSQLRRSAPIRAVAVCRVAPVEHYAIEPLSRPEALLAIAPSSMLEIHGRRRTTLDVLARLVERVPCVRLLLGPDIGRLPDAIPAVLERVRGGGRR